MSLARKDVRSLELASPVEATRRGAFLAALAAGLAALASLAACARRRARHAGVPVPIVDLPLGRRVVVGLKETPVEIVRTERAVTARALLCTHRGCPVIWKEELAAYHCPCHEGRFDADGRPVAGPPNRPLRTYAVTLADGSAWVEI